MTGEDSLASGNILTPSPPAKQVLRTSSDSINSFGFGIASPPATFIVSQNGYSPPEPGRKRRRYGDEERRQVAQKRKVGACELHRASKTKCTHACSNGTASTTQRYLDEGEVYEKFALGLTSTKEHMKELTQSMERNIAAVDKKTIPKSNAPNSKPTRRSKTQAQPNPPNGGSYGSFKLSSSPNQFTSRLLSPNITPKGLMSPPASRPRGLPSQGHPLMGGTAMIRGDSGYSQESVDSVPSQIPSLIFSAHGGPMSTQCSPPQNPIPYTMSAILATGETKGPIASSGDNERVMSLDPSRTRVNNTGFRNIDGTGVADPVLFPPDDDNPEEYDPEAFDFTYFLNDTWGE